jgi:molecular chaperone DnaK
MPIRCGIDLGTTYSAISYFSTDDNRVERIDLESADGANVVRSVVCYPGPGNRPVIGETAWNFFKQDPSRVIRGIKRSMGTDFQTALIDGVSYSPPQVSAVILSRLVEDAQKYLGEEVRDVVITVPAYFGDNERAATEEAGRLAGLNLLGLLPEPHAAALAYAVQQIADIRDRHLLVFDLGGGTLDVTLIHAYTSSNAKNRLQLQIDTVCKDGHRELGGLDWDKQMSEIVAEKVKQKHGVDIWEDIRNEGVVYDNCEKAKRALGQISSVSVVSDLAGHAVDVSLSEFEDRTSDRLLMCRAFLERVLEDAEKIHNIPKSSIAVMLAGGATKMPMVARMIEGVTGRPPFFYRNPESLVSIGAAYWAHLMDGEIIVSLPTPEGPKPTTIVISGLMDITAKGVGVEVLHPDGRGGWAPHNVVIIPAGARFGEQFCKEFGVAEDDATEVNIVLYEGDSPDIAGCSRLMTFTITRLPPGLKRGTGVNVELGFDSNGIIRGRATLKSGQAVDIVYDRSKVKS